MQRALGRAAEGSDSFRPLREGDDLFPSVINFIVLTKTNCVCSNFSNSVLNLNPLGADLQT